MSSDWWAIPIVGAIFVVILIIVLALLKSLKAVNKRVKSHLTATWDGPDTPIEIPLPNPLMSRQEDMLLSRDVIAGLTTPPKKTFALPRKPGSLFSLSFEYDESSSLWRGVWQLVGIFIYGDEEGPQPARCPVVQAVTQVLEELEVHAKAELKRRFDVGGDYRLLAVSFGDTGDEPADEFYLHFGEGRRDRRIEYTVQCRLNSEHPEKSTILDCRRPNLFVL